MASSSCIASPPTKKTTTGSSLSAFASHSLSFAPQSSPFWTNSTSSLSSMRFSIDRRTSGQPSESVAKQKNTLVSSTKRMCTCAPTTHPGSFRCSYHRRLAVQQKNQAVSPSIQSSSTGLNLRRSAIKNSLVRSGGVEGELVKRTLTPLIRPSSNQLRRREAFKPMRSRLWMTS